MASGRERRAPARALALAALLCSIASGVPVRAQGSGSEAAVRGRAVYESRCFACHSVDAHRIGPAHLGVFGRQAGLAPGFDYSSALRASKLVWNAENLDRWLADPERVIPGQAMGYRLENAQLRADVIAYLASLRPSR